MIKLAKTAGFCFGMNRAVDLTYKLVSEKNNVCTLGPLIHNPQVIEDLSEKGVSVADDLSSVESGSTVVVRTHGVPKSVINELENRQLDYVDATCPFVKKIHNIVSKYGKDVPVLIAGDEKHPEVIGIRGYCNGESIVFGNSEELEKILENRKDLSEKELIVVSQTTFSLKEWKKCEKKINFLCTNAKQFDTICNATMDRQTEALELSAESDAMIIIGGRHSSNTAKLKAVCEPNCPTYLVERPEELNDIDFSGCACVGVTAGASTPGSIIKEVLKTMSEILENKVEQEITAVEGAAVEEVATEAENLSVDGMDFSEALEESLKNLSSEQEVKGVVMGFSPSEIQVDIGRKHAGFVPNDEYSADPNAVPSKELKIGDVIDLIIMKTNDIEGTVMLSKRRYDARKSWGEVFGEDVDLTEKVFEGVVSEVVNDNKGVIAYTNGIRVFIPASLATYSRNESLEDLVKTKVKFRIIEADRRRKRAVGSIKELLKEERKAKEDAFWAAAQVGQVYQGTVKTITDYGVFVEFEGVVGMVHISELSWKRIKHPSEVVKEGDVIEVYIKSLNDEKRKISLGYKKAEDNPWEILRRDYPVDTVCEAEVVGMTTFGAFARVIPGIDGLIHISQIANRHIEKPQDELSIGDKVQVKITAIDFDKKRVSLSIRALTDVISDAEEVVVEEAAEAEEATEE